ncbi:MAG: hypothetical protein ACM3SS_05740 [Rhodospirillaceae bacterium]
MTHAEFRDAYANGRVRLEIDPAVAARFVSARLLLPLATLPVVGIGVGLALVGWVVTGLMIMTLGILLPRLIKRSAPHFIVTQALSDERFYNDAVKDGVLRVTGGEIQR